MFGAKGDVRDNVHFVDETTVLYAAGNQIVLHHIESNSQRFIPGAPDGEGITALALSPNRKYLAIAERAEKATISVLDLTTHIKRKKVMSSAEVNAKVRTTRTRPRRRLRVSTGATFLGDDETKRKTDVAIVAKTPRRRSRIRRPAALAFPPRHRVTERR